MHFNSKITPTSDINYSCCIKVAELILIDVSYVVHISHHIMLLVIHSLGVYTHTYIDTHTDFLGRRSQMWAGIYTWFKRE